MARARDLGKVVVVFLVLASFSLFIVAAGQPALAGSPPPRHGPDDAVHLSVDRAGVLGSASSDDFAAGASNGYFTELGTNGRTCESCHVPADAWSFTPRHARSLPRHDPLFTPNDGSNCPPTDPSQRADKGRSSLLVRYGLIRVQLPIPDGADFVLASATNPERCAIAPASAGANGQLFVFRRPLATTNLVFDSSVMWDGRETLEPITTHAGLGLAPLLDDLADQANGATTGHAQGGSIVGTPVQSDIVAFEEGLFTAQAAVLPRRRGLLAVLDADGSHGGPEFLRDSVAPAFAIGINDPLKPGFTSSVFDVYAAWEPTSPQYEQLPPREQAIGRGEAIFDTKTFVIRDVPGLNSMPSDPLYDPADPFAGQDIVAGCGLCHNNPNVGNHSSPLAVNIGVTMAAPVNDDGSPNTALHLAHLPVYTLQSSATGAFVQVTDPGRALVTGKWSDVGKTKGPILRGLAGRAPYMHNGSARDLRAVVEFYDQRFDIGLTRDEKSDLVAFLNAL